MPPKRAPDAKDAKECMLQIGKYNNVVAWNLDVRASVGATYGSSALFLTTDVRYVPPLPRDSDYVVTYPTSDGEQAPVGMSAELRADLKKDAFTSRQREMRKQIYRYTGREEDIQCPVDEDVTCLTEQSERAGRIRSSGRQ